MSKIFYFISKSIVLLKYICVIFYLDFYFAYELWKFPLYTNGKVDGIFFPVGMRTRPNFRLNQVEILQCVKRNENCGVFYLCANVMCN